MAAKEVSYEKNCLLMGNTFSVVTISAVLTDVITNVVAFILHISIPGHNR